MDRFNRITVFEVNKRLRQLQDFSDALNTYFSNIKYPGPFQDGIPTNNAAYDAREKLNYLLSDVIESMAIAGTSPHINCQQPAVIGGRSYTLDLMHNIFHLPQHQIDPLVVADNVEQTIGKYRSNIRKACIRTFNPFFWLNEIIIYVIGAPFKLLADMGLVSKDNRAVALLNNLFVFLGTLLTYATAMVGLIEKIGYLGALKALIHRTF